MENEKLVSSSASFDDFFQPEELTGYEAWKLKRKFLLKTLGSKLLSITEQQLINVFSNWEKNASNMSKSNSTQSILSSFMYIALIHYFKKDLPKVQSYFKILVKHVESTQNDVAYTAASVIRNFAKSSTDRTLYLKQVVKVADKIFQKRNEKKYFNGLLILRSLAKYINEDVFQVTTKFIPELITCVFSSKVELQDEAIKVFYNHIKSLPNEFASFIEGIVFDCRREIASIDEAHVFGSIKLIRSIFPIASKYVQPTAFILQINEYFDAFTPKLSIAAIDLITFFVKSDPNCFPKTLQQSTLSMVIEKCTKYPQSSKILLSLKDLVGVIPKENILINDILTLISNNIDSYGDIGFIVLNELLKFFPEQLLSISIFQDAQPDLYYLKVLKKQKYYLTKEKKKLIEKFNYGIKSGEPKNEIIALKILQNFGFSLFENPSTSFETILPLMYSNNEEVRLELVISFRKLNLYESYQYLLRMAVFDSSKLVRLKAIHQLDKCKEFFNTDMVQLLLADVSYKVRRNAISILWTLAKQNPLKPIPFISNYLKQMLISETSPLNSSRSAKACSLLPMVAEYLINDTPSFIPYLTWICVALLCGDEHFPEFPEDAGPPFMDLGKVFNQDFVADDFKVNFSPKNPYLFHVFQIENSKYSSRRAKYLFDTLRTLSPHIFRFIYQVFPVFSITFKTYQPEYVLLSALKALVSIVSYCDKTINFTQLAPDLLSSLFRILGDNCSEEVAIYIFKATGTMGTSSFSRVDIMRDENPDLSSLSDCVLKCLCKGELTPKILETLTIVLTQDTEAGIPYLDIIIPKLITTIENNKVTSLFQSLELIVWKCNFYIEPYLKMIEPLLVKYIQNVFCIYFCGQLSYQLKTAFTTIASHIYPLILNNLQKFEEPLNQPMYKLIAFMVTFQRQNFDTFLNIVDQKIDLGWKPPPQLLLCILRILKFNSFSFFCARIMSLCLKLLPFNELSDLIFQTISFLIIQNNIPYEFINKALIRKFPKKLTTIYQILTHQPYLKSKLSFLKDVNLKPGSVRLNAYLSKVMDYLKKKNPDGAFSSVNDITFNNSTKWIYDLTSSIFSCSPVPSIRVCTQLVLQSQTLRNELYPIAFLSCWKIASDEQKKVVSNIVSNIFSQFSFIDPMLIVLAETLERANCPFLVSKDLIAMKCTSPALRVYFLYSHLSTNPKSEETIEALLKVNTSMGRLDCARGLLSRESQIMPRKDSGKWFEQLGEWSKALKIYEKEADSIEKYVSLIKCYGHLEQWDTIRNMVPLFDQMNINERSHVALWFSWAFYHSGDFEQVKNYSRFFSGNDTKQQIFIILYYIASGQLDKAELQIENSFKTLVKDKNVFDGSDTGLATKLLVSAQHLIELEEALKAKRDNLKTVPKMWKNRLKIFRHGSDAWMKLIEIRSILLLPEEHIGACLKMISTLRKERKWRLIDGYFDRLFSSIKSPEVILSEVKIKWARGQLNEAISLISCFNLFIEGKKTEKDHLFEGISIPNDKFRARLLRIQGNMQFQVSGNNEPAHLEAVRKCFKTSLELNGNDYRSLAGLAYASSRMINFSSDMETKYSLAYDVITSFLKATQIHPESSIEFLCQLFSIYFQYGNNITIDNFVNDITSLPTYTISQIVPQLVSHIAHSSKNVRVVINSIIESYGVTHFETVYYPLNFSHLSGESQKAVIANEIINRMKMSHIQTSMDAELFVDGMRMAAISWFEEWIATVGTAIKYIDHKDIQALNDLLKEQFEKVHHPRCEFDSLFAKKYMETINQCKELLDGDLTNLELFLLQFQKDLDLHLRKIDQIQLNKISSELAAKRHFHLSIPGQEDDQEKPPKIFMIDPCFTVLRTQQHPRSVFIVDEKGKKWRFLLKGKEDLRMDQRIMQLFRLINTLLSNDRLTSSLEIKIVQYPIVPFSKDCGLIGWVGGADTLQHLVSELRSIKDIPQLLEINILHNLVGQYAHTQTFLQRKEVFDDIVLKAPANELHDIIWLKSPDPETWLQRVDNFTKSTGLMSITGYIIGLGDRHPSNIMIQRDTGRVIHIDFGDSFESAMHRKSYPERVPFRLTRMIINAFDCGGIDGLFRRTCEDTMNVLREHRTSIFAQLEIFVHEPIFSCFENQNTTSLLDRIEKKLIGHDPIPDKLNNTNQDPAEVEWDVPGQVDELINSAKDPNNYMQHYLGWCPFW